MRIISNKSKFLRHEQCPDCASRGRDRHKDNLGVWEDGHKRCFSCGYSEQPKPTPNQIVMQLQALNDGVKGPTEYKRIHLPADCAQTFPDEVSRWWRAYGITDKEAITNNFTWSGSWERLIMPVYRQMGQLAFWEGRAFAPNKSRYHIEGNPTDFLDIIGPRSLNQDCLVLVEDKLSAIKIARRTTVMVLHGSHLPLSQIVMLRNMFNRIVMWLDFDKAKDSMSKIDTLGNYFDEARMVLTEKDPKCYNNMEIFHELKKVKVMT